MSADPDLEIAIVGGGPAGAAVACHLAREGRRLELLERDVEPRHKICGEFLSTEAQAYLAGLDIDPNELGAVPISTLRLVHESECAEAPLPFRAVGLTRRTLDQALLRKSEDLGATVRRGTTVRALTTDEGPIRIRASSGESVSANTVFLATGKHDLRDFKRPRSGPGADLIGFKTYFALVPAQRAALMDIIEVILFDGGYAGLQNVEAGLTNLCLLVEARLFDKVGRRWPALFDHLCESSSHLRDRFADAQPILDEPLAISNVPYGFVHRPSPEDPEGLFRLGDQMGVIQSFSGDGISIALHTAEIAAATYLDHGNAAPRYHLRAAQEIAPQITLASHLYEVSRTRIGRLALLWAGHIFPSALSLLAACTRIPGQALARSGAISRTGANRI